MTEQDEFEVQPIDDARREQLRRDPLVRHCHTERQRFYVPALSAEGVSDIRQLLDRDEEGDLAHDAGAFA